MLVFLIKTKNIKQFVQVRKRYILEINCFQIIFSLVVDSS